MASSATAVVKIIGKAIRGGKLCYYVDDGVYHTFSGVIFDHCQYPLKSFAKGPTQICSVFGPTCDALDTISLAEQLPDLELGDLLYAPNIGRLLGGQQHATSTGFRRPKWCTRTSEPAGAPPPRPIRALPSSAAFHLHAPWVGGQLPMIRRRCDAIKGFDICR